MSTSRGSSGGVQAIPAASRKMVQSLKEIVNWPEAEIYAVLKDCNMDPNEAVNRLLSQDPFHEVKSKRGKRKEGKDASESRTGGANKPSTRGGKGGVNRHMGHGGPPVYNTSEPGILHGKPSYKKENGATPYISSSSSTTGMTGNNVSRQHASDVTVTNDKVSSLGGVDAVSSGTQPSSGYQHVWGGVPGQVSMADIVKMGRHRPPPPTLHQNLNYQEHHTSKVVEPETSSAPNLSANDEWPSMDTPADAKELPVAESHADYDVHAVTSNLPIDGINQHSQMEEGQETEYDEFENLEEDNPRDASPFENDQYGNMGSYEPAGHDFEGHDFEHHEGEDVGELVSSVTGNIQNLSIQNDDSVSTPEEDAPFVVIPDHLRVEAAECLHLHFGTFRSVPADSSANPAKTNLEEANTEPNNLSVVHSDTRNSEYFGDDSLRNASDDSLFHRTGATAGNYDTPSASQPEELKQENSESAQEDQYAFTAPNPSYPFQDPHHLNAAFSQSQTSSHMQNLAPFSNVPSYTDPLPSTLLGSNINPGRESEFQHQTFPATQLMPTEYGNSASVGGSAISMSEINQALKTVDFSSAQPAPPTGVPTGSPLPQHLPVHPYSQPTLPLGPFANMIGYPFLPAQSYAYMPSAFQQAFAGNSAYHQSLAAMLPQYKSSVSVNNAPQSTGYSGIGNTVTIPGNFSMNPPAASSGTTLNYEDVLSSQYKDLMSLQQNENSGGWVHGPNSRTTAVPAATYYNYEGPNPQSGGFRQGQQPSQNYGAPGYPNFYHSPNGISLEQPQMQREGSQGQPKQSQVWQNY